MLDKERWEICQWLQCTDPSPLHYRHRYTQEPETGKWVLRTEIWNNWLSGKQRSLWIYGIPGAGKSVLASFLIEEVKKHCGEQSELNLDFVYYYCYFGHNQDETAPSLRWLLSQLCRKAQLIPTSAHRSYQLGGEPSVGSLLDGVEDVLSNTFEGVYVLVDALDESTGPREDLLNTLRIIATEARFEKIKLLTTSREYVDIERSMKEHSVAGSMANQFVEEDIRIYVRSAFKSNPRLKRWPDDILDEVEIALTKGASGMYVFAGLLVLVALLILEKVSLGSVLN